MWIWMTVASAVLLGCYDIAKKHALRRNGVLWILLLSSALTTLFLCPFLTGGPLHDHLRLIAKALLVSSSWISGLIAMKLLPLTTASSLKASRPMFVVIFSIILFGERLNLWQWVGIVLIIGALFMLGRSSRKDGIRFTQSKGVAWMMLSILTGAASALYDKHIIRDMDPLFVQSWANLYITLVMGAALIVKRCCLSKKVTAAATTPAGNNASIEPTGFRWDWTIILIAALITAADALYFFALKQDGAMLSVVSMVRRCSVVVTFIGGALLFKEHNIRDKAVDLGILLAGLALLLYSS